MLSLILHILNEFHSNPETLSFVPFLNVYPFRLVWNFCFVLRPANEGVPA
jgi:hypothetical protein